jgi:hypothetical protein
VLPFDGSEPLPKYVIACDPGMRSALTVVGVVKEHGQYTFRSAALSRGAYTRPGRVAAKTMSKLTNSDSTRVGQALSRKMQNSVRSARSQESAAHALILKDLFQLLRRPLASDPTVLGPPPKCDEVMLIIGGAPGKFSAPARTLLHDWATQDRSLRIRMVNEYMTSKVQVDGEPLGECARRMVLCHEGDD